MKIITGVNNFISVMLRQHQQIFSAREMQNAMQSFRSQNFYEISINFKFTLFILLWVTVSKIYITKLSF